MRPGTQFLNSTSLVFRLTELKLNLKQVSVSYIPYVLVSCRYSDWLGARWLGFDSRQRQDFSLHSVEIGSEAHSASHPMGTGCGFSGGKAAGA
jgi:hypothetical protein